MEYNFMHVFYPSPFCETRDTLASETGTLLNWHFLDAFITFKYARNGDLLLPLLQL